MVHTAAQVAGFFATMATATFLGVFGRQTHLLTEASVAALETALREPRRAEQERDDYSSFSAGGREGDEVPRE